jgi:hypothetical protein
VVEVSDVGRLIEIGLGRKLAARVRARQGEAMRCSLRCTPSATRLKLPRILLSTHPTPHFRHGYQHPGPPRPDQRYPIHLPPLRPPSEPSSTVTESVCGFVAICMTLFRLWLRRSRPWWDDAWAFFSLVWYVPLPLCSALCSPVALTLVLRSFPA